MSIFDWQTTASVERIQNTNYVADFVDDFYRQYNTYKGLVLTQRDYDKGLYLLRSQDNTVRIPGRLKSTDVYMGIGNTTYQLNFSPSLSGQGMAGNTLGSTAENDLLDYIPRMYVELTALSDFLDMLTVKGVTHHYTDTFLYNYYEQRNSGRLMYDTTELLPNRPELLVLTKIVIYTNKNDGTEQTALATYNWDDSISNSKQRDWYDTYLPFEMYSNNASRGGPVGSIFYLPYMRQFRAHQITQFKGTDYAYAVGGVPGVHDIRRVTSTGDGDIKANPWLSAVVYSKDNEIWNLTSSPSDPYYTYIAADMKTWKNILNGSGMPWSTVLEDVTAPDDSGLNKPTTPGQPTNPVDDNPGTGDNLSDEIEYPDLLYIPNSTVYDRYFLSPNQIVDVKKFLFSDTFIDNIKRIWTNPAEYVISLCFYPFDIVNSNIITTDTLVSVGGITSGVSALAATDSGLPYFYGGSVDVGNYYNSYLDYEPYTSIDIYIPYIGVRPLNVSQIVGHRLCIGYYIDFNTQQITALIGLDGNSSNLGQVVTQYIGTVGVNTPLSGTSAQDVTRNIVTQTAGLITGVGALAGGVATGNIAAAAAGASATVSTLTGKGYTSPNYYGSLSPISGLISPQSAYLIINRPIAAEPDKFKEQVGYSSCYSSIGLGAYSGFLKCAAVDIPANSNMTEEEQKEIESLLLGGIYIE